MTPKIIPVIHYADDMQAHRNADLAFEAGCEGVLLIEMRGRSEPLPKVATSVKERWPDRLVGINYLGVDPALAIRWNTRAGLDMTWTDQQLTHSSGGHTAKAEQVARYVGKNPGHLLFCGVAFKYQDEEPDPVAATRSAIARGFVPTTSGSATGVSAEVEKIANIRLGIGPYAPLAIASGITPDNAAQFAPHLSHILVATGVSSSFHEFDADLIADLRRACGLA